MEMISRENKRLRSRLSLIRRRKDRRPSSSRSAIHAHVQHARDESESVSNCISSLGDGDVESPLPQKKLAMPVTPSLSEEKALDKETVEKVKSALKEERSSDTVAYRDQVITTVLEDDTEQVTRLSCYRVLRKYALAKVELRRLAVTLNVSEADQNEEKDEISVGSASHRSDESDGPVDEDFDQKQIFSQLRIEFKDVQKRKEKDFAEQLKVKETELNTCRERQQEKELEAALLTEKLSIEREQRELLENEMEKMKSSMSDLVNFLDVKASEVFLLKKELNKINPSSESPDDQQSNTDSDKDKGISSTMMVTGSAASNLEALQLKVKACEGDILTMQSSIGEAEKAENNLEFSQKLQLSVQSLLRSQSCQYDDEDTSEAVGDEEPGNSEEGMANIVMESLAEAASPAIVEDMSEAAAGYEEPEILEQSIASIVMESLAEAASPTAVEDNGSVGSDQFHESLNGVKDESTQEAGVVEQSESYHDSLRDMDTTSQSSAVPAVSIGEPHDAPVDYSSLSDGHESDLTPENQVAVDENEEKDGNDSESTVSSLGSPVVMEDASTEAQEEAPVVEENVVAADRPSPLRSLVPLNPANLVQYDKDKAFAAIFRMISYMGRLGERQINSYAKRGKMACSDTVKRKLPGVRTIIVTLAACYVLRKFGFSLFRSGSTGSSRRRVGFGIRMLLFVYLYLAFVVFGVGKKIRLAIWRRLPSRNETLFVVSSTIGVRHYLLPMSGNVYQLLGTGTKTAVFGLTSWYIMFHAVGFGSRIHEGALRFIDAVRRKIPGLNTGALLVLSMLVLREYWYSLSRAGAPTIGSWCGSVIMFIAPWYIKTILFAIAWTAVFGVASCMVIVYKLSQPTEQYSYKRRLARTRRRLRW